MCMGYYLSVIGWFYMFSEPNHLILSYMSYSILTHVHHKLSVSWWCQCRLFLLNKLTLTNNNMWGRFRALHMIKIATWFTEQTPILQILNIHFVSGKIHNHGWWKFRTSDQTHLNPAQIPIVHGSVLHIYVWGCPSALPSDRLIARLVGIFKVSLQDPPRTMHWRWRGTHEYWCSMHDN